MRNAVKTAYAMAFLLCSCDWLSGDNGKDYKDCKVVGYDVERNDKVEKSINNTANSQDQTGTYHLRRTITATGSVEASVLKSLAMKAEVKYEVEESEDIPYDVPAGKHYKIISFGIFNHWTCIEVPKTGTQTSANVKGHKVDFWVPHAVGHKFTMSQ